MSTEVREAVLSQGEGLSKWDHLRYGLGRTLLIWFLLLPVMSLVVAGIIISTITFRNARQAAVERLSAIATLKQSEINAWVANQQAELALIATTPDVRSKLLYALSGEPQDPLAAATRDYLQQYFTAITSKRSSFEEFFLLDASGRVLVSSDPSQVGASHQQQAYFVKGQEGPYLHPPYYSLYTAAPSMVVAQPVEDNSGRVWGVLAGRLNLNQMSDVTKEEAGLGQTGETYLVNAVGLLLTTPRFGGELTLGEELHSEGVARGLSLEKSASHEHQGWSVYTDYRGQRVLGIYRWFPDLQMVLLAEQEMNEILAVTGRILATNLAILFLMAGVAAGIALLVSGRITRPLVGLTTTANLIASGDLSHEVPHSERKDEIGTLARAFDQMSQQLRDLITGLEDEVTQRTRQWQEANYELQRRAIQLEAVTLVGRAVTSILNLDDLLLEVVNLIRARFDFYHAGIFLIDESGEWAVLRQATGEAGQHMLARKHQLAVGGQSIVGWVTGNRQPRIVLDVGEDSVHFKNPDLPHTRSEMALPLIVGDQLLGALDVQSVEEAAFDEEDVTILSLMADQVAVAIENALKFSQEAAILEATSPLYRASQRIALATSLDDVLESIIDHAAGPHIDRCTLNLYAEPAGEQKPAWLEVAAVWDRADDAPNPPGARYPVGRFTLIEHLCREAAEPLAVEDLLADVIDQRVDSETHRMLTEELQLRAVLMLPLVAAGRPTGLLMAASRQPHTWSEAEMRTFRALSAQVASAVENARLFGEAQVRARREQVIRQITEQMWRAVDVESILQATVTRLGQAMGVPRVYARLGTEIELGSGNGNPSASPQGALDHSSPLTEEEINDEVPPPANLDGEINRAGND
jgi:GAF domain-containing protein/HAMP domain-containing protein